MTAKLRQHSHSLSVRKLQELLHDCNIQLATFRNCVQQIGTCSDSQQLRRELDTNVKACVRACEATKNCVLPQLKHEGVEFTRHANQFIGCVGACVVELRRCEALEKTYRMNDVDATAGGTAGGGATTGGGDNDSGNSDEAPPVSVATAHIPTIEAMQETLENLITVHYSTSEPTLDTKVTPRRRRMGTCRPQCMCSKLKTSYA